jgi:hypothetical protein
MPRTPEPYMHLHLAHADHHPPVRTDLAVHLAGHHQTHAVLLARTIVLTMPSVRVRLAHPQPVYEAYTAWMTAGRRAAQLFAEGLPGVVPGPEGHVSGQIRLDLAVRRATVEPLRAEVSPTRAPQLRVRIGGLLTVVTDMDACTSQLTLWTAAYRHATHRWSNLPTVEELAAGASPSFEDVDAPPVREAA